MVDLLLHVITAILAGALPFRACLTGQGHGNLPGIAILAGVATGTMALIFSLIFVDMVPERHKHRVQGGLIGFLILLHFLAF